MTSHSYRQAAREKRRASLISVLAVSCLILLKVTAGLLTGSLGILAQAADSVLDLVASVLAFFAVRVADQPPDTEHPYGHGKVACDEFLTEQYRKNGRPVTSLRLAHPYGPRDHMLYTTGRESLFLDRMRRGRTVIIPGTGQTRMHPIYVKDAARAFVYVLGRTECMGKIYNLSGDEILTLDEYFASIARVLGVPLVARRIPHEWFRDNAQLWSDWRRNFDFGYNWPYYESAFDVTALRQTGFRCQTDHDSGVALMMEWLDSNGLVEPSSDKDEEDLIFDHLTSMDGDS